MKLQFDWCPLCKQAMASDGARTVRVTGLLTGSYASDGARTVRVTGLLTGSYAAHPACWEVFFADLERKRAQFDELLAAGVSRDEANRIMIARMDGEATS